MSKLPVYFPDGYTSQARVDEYPGLHGAVAFRFRPMSPDQYSEFLVEMRSRDPKKYNPQLRKIVASHILEWDVEDQDGKSLPIDAATLVHMPRRLYERIYGIVSGEEASDPINGEVQVPGLEQAEADRKN